MEKARFTARDGVELSFDQYFALGKDGVEDKSQAKATLIFLHGSTYNSRRYAAVAKTAQKQQYNVLLPDWRGHGESGGNRGDLSYVGQLEDDLADLVAHYHKHHDLPLVIGGHSAGSVVCLRYIDKYGCDDINGSVFVSPALNRAMEAVRFTLPAHKTQYKVAYFRDMPTTQEAPPQALKHAPVFKHRAFWAAKFLPFLRHRPILTFPANEKMAKMEGRVLNYSYNMMNSCDLHHYPQAFNKITVPTLIMAGDNDEIVHPNLVSTIYHWHLSPLISKKLVELPKVNHTAVVSAAARILPGWLDEIYPELSQAKAAQQAVDNSNPVDVSTRTQASHKEAIA